jgi:hypothetical protein
VHVFTGWYHNPKQNSEALRNKMDQAGITIAKQCAQLFEKFDRLEQAVQSPTHSGSDFSGSEHFTLDTVREVGGDFRVWAGNIAAHRVGRISLDHRLRNAQRMKDQVSGLLRDLSGSLSEGKQKLVNLLGSCRPDMKV